MYYSDTFKSDKKTVTLAINEFRKRGPAEISTVEQICYSCQVNLSIRETVYHNNRTRF